MSELNNNSNLNAADRKSFVGQNYNIGKKIYKKNVFEKLPEFNGPVCYEHDADAYGLTYNCLGFDIRNAFPYENFASYDVITKIIRTFDFMKELFAKMNGNSQF